MCFPHKIDKVFKFIPQNVRKIDCLAYFVIFFLNTGEMVITSCFLAGFESLSVIKSAHFVSGLFIFE